MFLSDFGSREVFGEAFHSREGCCVLHDGGAGGRGVFGVVYGRSCGGDPCGSVQRERVAAAEDQRGEDSVARSLRNRDAGDSDARHLADGHLEQ